MYNEILFSKEKSEQEGSSHGFTIVFECTLPLSRSMDVLDLNSTLNIS